MSTKPGNFIVYDVLFRKSFYVAEIFIWIDEVDELAKWLGMLYSLVIRAMTLNFFKSNYI